MPEIDFFATRADLIPILRTVERAVAVQYLPCYSAEARPQPFYFAAAIPPDVFHKAAFLVMPREAEYTTNRSGDGEGAQESFETIVSEDTPHLCLDFGHEGRSAEGTGYLKSGTISTRGADYSDEDYTLYHAFLLSLNQSLRPMGWNPCWYGMDALRIGSLGHLYVQEGRESEVIPDGPGTWRHSDLIAEQTELDAMPKPQRRVDREATWDLLEQMGFEPPRDAEGRPDPPKGDLSHPANEERSLDFFRTKVWAQDLSCLSLSRTLFARSEMSLMRFRGADLQRSLSNYCDWLDCDLREADLSHADLRCCRFYYCDFSNANLTGADLRESSFVGCDFTGAEMQGACMYPDDRGEAPLSERQIRAMNWNCRKGHPPRYG